MRHPCVLLCIITPLHASIPARSCVHLHAHVCMHTLTHAYANVAWDGLSSYTHKFKFVGTLCRTWMAHIASRLSVVCVCVQCLMLHVLCACVHFLPPTMDSVPKSGACFIHALCQVWCHSNLRCDRPPRLVLWLPSDRGILLL